MITTMPWTITNHKIWTRELKLAQQARHICGIYDIIYWKQRQGVYFIGYVGMLCSLYRKGA